MASKEHVGAQFKGVLHGYDAHGSKFSMPYEVGSKQEILEAGKTFSEHARPTEHSHEGSCEQAGCKFSDINYGSHFEDPFGGGNGAYG